MLKFLPTYILLIPFICFADVNICEDPIFGEICNCYRHQVIYKIEEMEDKKYVILVQENTGIMSLYEIINEKDICQYFMNNLKKVENSKSQPILKTYY